MRDFSTRSEKKEQKQVCLDKGLKCMSVCVFFRLFGLMDEIN